MNEAKITARETAGNPRRERDERDKGERGEGKEGGRRRAAVASAAEQRQRN